MRAARICAVLIAIGSTQVSFSAEIPKVPVPPSPYLPIIYKFADAILEQGTNRVEVKSGPIGVAPHHQENWLRVLYTLSELSGKPKYRNAADTELRRFVENQERTRQDFVRPWVLWDRCFELAPESSKRAALAVREHQIGTNSAREAGFYIRTWAAAYAHTTNELFLKSIDALVARCEKKAPSTNVSLAIDCDAASRLVPEPLASRLRALADREDKVFCSLPHDLKSSTPLRRVPNDGYTTAQIAMMCVSRYENTGKVEYRDLIHAAADAYLGSLPGEGVDALPMTFGHAISLELAAWRSTARQAYLDRARALADIAVKRFFDAGPLPRASFTSQNGEAITGVDTLSLALVELHLHILHITAVRCPSNTIDR
ncbi:MAG TPA: hypothetical protein VK615_15720 [Candidatus Binatia bacterium]|nr:hypothetical protein [Candidatus Binatia bacterium]